MGHNPTNELPYTESSGNVFEDLGFDKEEALSLRVRSQLMANLHRYIREHGLNQRAAARVLGTSQPRISSLVNGKIDLFTIDALIDMHAHAGLRVTLAVEDAEAV